MFKEFPIKNFFGQISELFKNAYNSDYQPTNIQDCLLLGSVNFIMLGLGLLIIYGFSLIFNFQFQVSPFMKIMLFFGYIRYFSWFIIWKFKQK